jgi:hypothetical protein
MSDCREYLTVKDFRNFLEEFPDDMKVFFFDVDKDESFLFSPETVLHHITDIGLSEVKENGETVEIREEVLAFVRKI